MILSFDIAPFPYKHAQEDSGVNIFVPTNPLRGDVLLLLLIIFFGQKCVFYACFTLIGSWEGWKNFRVGISLNKNLLG